MSMTFDTILYHGAIQPVVRPLVGIGRTDLDFGPGFYVTNDRQQAEKWARTKANRSKGGIPYINVYEFNEKAFRAENYKILLFPKYDKEWLDFIAQSRKGQQPWKNFDFIEGGIANDQVINTVDLYVDGIYTVTQALDLLVNEKLRHQICISKQEIIDKYLKFKKSIAL